MERRTKITILVVGIAGFAFLVLAASLIILATTFISAPLIKGTDSDPFGFGGQSQPADFGADDSQAEGPEHTPLPKPPPHMRSEPEDPWSIEPIPVTVMIAVLPFREEEGYTLMGRTLAVDTIEHLSVNPARHIGIHRVYPIFAAISATADYTADDFYNVPDDLIEDLLKYHPHTHLISGVYTIEDEDLRLRLRMEAPEGEFETEIHLPQHNRLELSRLAVLWMAEKTDLGLNQVQMDTLRKPIVGEGVPSLTEGLGKEIADDPDHPYWRQLLREDRHNHTLRLRHAITVAHVKEGAELIAHDPGPLPGDATFPEHLTRIRIHGGTGGNPGVVRHEYELLLAKFPGHISQVIRFADGAIDSGVMRREFVEVVEKWRQRLPDHFPIADFHLAFAYRNAAWDYRGTRFAHHVNPHHWDIFHEYLDRARTLHQKADWEGAPNPLSAYYLISIAGATGRRDDMQRQLERSLERWPNYKPAIESALNYMRPRWGGNHYQTMQFIEDIMTSRPDHPGMATLAFTYHHGEAGIGYEYTAQTPYADMLWHYASAKPAERGQLVRAARILSGENAHLREAVKALEIAGYLKDQQLGEEIVQRRPDVYKHVLCCGSFNGKGRALLSGVQACVELGYWEEALEFMNRIDEHDQDVNNRGGEGWRLAMLRDTRIYTRNLVHAMNGNQVRLSQLEELSTSPATYPVYIYPKMIHGPINERDIQRLQETATELPGHPNAHYLLALHHHREGNEEQAAAYLQKARNATQPPWKALRNDVLRLMGVNEEAK